ncbi:Holliday junction branch migration protein RuvA [Oceanobacillus alkalisoli]|uniref:Holliday junction branch migration protein RuvA n=1 Tax=Oceanobacillus alkalisoli TaxID=2925113 RepID=UPI001EEFE5C9|nr:Holliday junction branch migration protein RuvA [Oceanobacillus alkalisoli]MCF3941874.1 Holliday junction branch migration protein RuvA [Oceanobacillus alkalisoli]MCG5104249.1 Holliday junction branch migration protein RuvA [Oceanobacillus alkalisoli]
MIAYIKGKLMAIQDEAVIVEAGGIGYELLCPNPFYYQNRLKEEVTIQTYHHVREDAQLLYGFKNEDEKYLFTKLISVSGIGPKGALGIMSAVDIPSFVAAVENEDEKFLTQFPGVGKKTARQIILDLKGKLTSSFRITPTDTEDISHTDEVALSEAKEALKALGYTERELTRIMPALRKENLSNSDEIVRKGLALLLQS